MNIADMHRLPSLQPLSFQSPRADGITWQPPIGEEPKETDATGGSGAPSPADAGSEASDTSPLATLSPQVSQTIRNFLLQLQERGFFNGDGNDIVNGLSGAQVEGSDEADHIAVGSDAMVNAGDGDDTVYAWSGASVDGGAGNDTLVTWSQSHVMGGAGDDRIDTWSDSRVEGGDGKDFISAWSNSIVDGGAGNDDISVWSNSVVDGGEGDDVIAAWTGSVVDGGAGNDRISVRDDSEVTGGTGDDTITIRSGTVNYALGDGNDTVKADGATTLRFGEGITADTTHIAYDGDTAKITFDGSDETITVEHRPGSSVQLSFSDGTSKPLESADQTVA